MKTTSVSASRASLPACKPPVLAIALLLSCLLGLGVRRADATGYTWDANTSSAVITDGTGIWSTSANDWVTAGVESAWVNGSDAQIGGAGLTGTNSISLSGNITVGNLYIAPTTSGTITADSSDTLTISGSMTASTNFVISGPVFFTDGLINSSSVTIGGVAMSGSKTITLSGSVNVAGGGISESDSNGGVTINGPEVGATSITVTNGTLTMSGSVAALSGGISVANGNLTLSGTTEGAASITITSGNLTLSGSNAALSGTIGISGGTLDMHSGTFASNFATNITQSNGTLIVNGTTFPTFTGTWGMSGGTLQVGGGAFTTAIGTGAGQLNITGAVTLAINANATGTFNFGSGELLTWGTGGFNPGTILKLNPNNQSTMTFANSIDLNGATRTIQDQANGYGTGDLILSGTLQNSGAAANLIFIMSNQRSQGDNWVVLTGSNTYTGTTFISGSTATSGNNNPMRLVLDTSGSFSSASYYITGTDGGQLQIMPGNGGTTYVSGNITNTGTDNVTNPGGNAYTYDSGYALIIGGTGAASANNNLVSGTGVTVLTGTNTYTGSTIIKSGTLQIGNGGTLGSLPSAGTGVTGNGVNGLVHTALVYDLSSNATLNYAMSGSMGFTQAGTGMIVLNNGSGEIYSGTTTISSGTLEFGDGATDGFTTGSSAVIANSGVVIFNNVSSETYSGPIGGNGSFIKSGNGNQNLTGNMGYSGTTGISAGTLTLSGSNANATAITVNGGTLALGGTNAIAGATSLTLNSGATLNVANGGATHVTTMAGSAGNALVLNGGTMNFGMGTNTADELVLTSGAVSMGGVITITATGYGTINLSTPQALIYAPGGGLVAGDFIASGISNATFTVTGGGTTLDLMTGVTITTAYWTGGGGDSNWSTDNNWSSDPAGSTASLTGPTASLHVVFSAASTSNETSTVLDQNTSALDLTIDDSNNVGIGAGPSNGTTLTLSNNSAITTGATSGTVTIGANVALTGAAPVIDLTGTNPLTISGSLSTTTGVLVEGTGMLVLSGNNTYTGGTVLLGGTLQINSASSLGASSGSLTFSGAASANLQANASFADSRNIILNTTTGVDTIDSNGNALVLSGGITGSGTLGSISSLAGGITILTGANTGFTGNISVGSGTLQFGNGSTNGSPSTTSSISVSSGAALSIDLSGVTTFANPIAGSGTLVDNGPAGNHLEITGSENIYNYIVNSGTMDIQGSATLFSGTTPASGSITINPGAELLNNLGNWIAGSSAANPNLTININGGIFYQNATNPNIGTLNMSSGTITIANGYSATYPGLSIRGPVITISGNGESFITTTNAANSNYSIKLSGSDTASLDITTFNVAATGAVSGVDLSVSADLADGYAVNSQNIVNTTFIKTGAGVMLLSGSNVWGGGTQINGGVLELGSANALPLQANATADVGGMSTGTVGAISFGGGTLEYSAGNQVDYSANFSNAASQAYSINTNSQQVAFATGLTSSGGTLVKLGSGTLSLNATNTYTGATTIDQDTLAVNGSVAGAVNVSPNANASATLAGTGAVGGLVTTTNGSGSNIAHIAPGVNTSGNFGGIGTLTLNGGLTIGNGTNLDFDLGTSSDLIAVTGQLSLGTGVVLNISQAAGFAAGTPYTLITYTGALTGDASTWTATGMPGGDTAIFTAASGVVSVTISGGSNDSTLVITPTPTAPSYISLGSVLVGSTPSSTVVTGSNGGTTGTGTYALVATGSASVSPSSPTLVPTGTTGLTVGAANPIGGNSGNNVVVGTISATNSANASGSLSPVNVTANVYQVASLTTGTINNGSSATLDLTNAASTDGGQRAGVTINGYSTTNSNFVVTTDNGGVVGTANGSDVTQDVGTVTVASNLLSGTYSYAGTVTGTAQYTDSALQSQGGGSLVNPQWSGVSISGTVNASAPYGQTNTAFIASGSSFAGYGLTSSQGNTTTATLLNGTASANTNLNMSFSAHGSLGGGETSSPSPFQSSDTLTLTGLHATGGNGPDGGSIITDPFVLQLSVTTNPNVTSGMYYLGWYDVNAPGGASWVNAIAGNSNANLPNDYVGSGAFAGTYAQYLTANSLTMTSPLSGELGAYGYDSTTGVAWAVLDYDSDIEVIPEPGTYAMIFSGFGMLVGFQRFRRRSQKNKR